MLGMGGGQQPRTAGALRAFCGGWPVTVVRRAVAVVVPEPDAALIAAWLTDPNAPPDAPPLTPDEIGEIANQLHTQRH